MRDVASAVLLLSGVALYVIAAVGLQRFDDVFTRMHVATKPATLGLILVLAGSALRMEAGGDVAKLALVAVLQLLTAPIGAHMVGRAAYRAGDQLGPKTVMDELGRDQPPASDGAEPTR